MFVRFYALRHMTVWIGIHLSKTKMIKIEKNSKKDYFLLLFLKITRKILAFCWILVTKTGTTLVLINIFPWFKKFWVLQIIFRLFKQFGELKCGRGSWKQFFFGLSPRFLGYASTQNRPEKIFLNIFEPYLWLQSYFMAEIVLRMK